VVAALNRDVHTFDNMVASLNYHMYQPVILANSGELGGSTALVPLRHHEHLVAHVHGNNQVAISVFDIDPSTYFRIFFLLHLQNLLVAPYWELVEYPPKIARWLRECNEYHPDGLRSLLLQVAH